MKVQKVNVDNKMVTQVFISKSEAEDITIQEKIKELKKEEINVVVFSAGEIDTAKTLKYMLQTMINTATVT